MQYTWEVFPSTSNVKRLRQGHGQMLITQRVHYTHKFNLKPNVLNSELFRHITNKNYNDILAWNRANYVIVVALKVQSNAEP